MSTTTMQPAATPAAPDDAPPPRRGSGLLGRRVGRAGQYVALALFLIFLAFPLLFLFTTAFKSQQELQSPSGSLLPQQWELTNFSLAMERANLAPAALNSLIVAIATTLVVVLIALPAAYALARLRTRLRGVATIWILLSQVFPFILIIIPLFLMLRQIGLNNSLPGLVIVYTTWSLPFALWMLQGYVAAIPAELEEAGAVDGAGRLRVLRSIVLPLLAPGLVATALFTFIGSWNEFFFALVLIQDPELQTLPQRLALFVGSEGQVQLGALAAASLLATIPSLLFFALIQRRLTSGLMSGAVKG